MLLLGEAGRKSAKNSAKHAQAIQFLLGDVGALLRSPLAWLPVDHQQLAVGSIAVCQKLTNHFLEITAPITHAVDGSMEKAPGAGSFAPVVSGHAAEGGRQLCLQQSPGTRVPVGARDERRAQRAHIVHLHNVLSVAEGGCPWARVLPKAQYADR